MVCHYHCSLTHTWVTTYDNQSISYGNVQQIVRAKQFFWYCWGRFHRHGGTPVNATGLLGEKSGDVALAQCLVQPNADSRTVQKARGAIFNQRMLDRAAALLGPENFEKIFEFPPTQRVNLVNPVIKQAADAAVGRPQTAHFHKKPGAQPTVTLRHLAAKLSEEHELTKREGEAILGELVSLITKHLKKGNRVRIAGFGILQVRTRAARMGRNPATGELMKIKSSKEIAFRPSSELKVG